MKEIYDIIQAYDAATLAGKRTALATVVHVEGSSYRRPGARMLVTEDGVLTGAISGGCLEGDALRKALLAINENKNRLVTYDTTNEEDALFGVQLGCNGIVHILFEPIEKEAKNNPLQLLKKIVTKRRDAALVTLFSLQKKGIQPGTSYLVGGNEVLQNETENIVEIIKQTLQEDTITALSNRTSIIKKYNNPDEEITAFIEVVPPPLSLVICGAGNDAIPLVTAAHLAGWYITVIDGRHTHATQQRFREANEIIVAKSEVALNEINIDDRTVFVLMTHNYNYDLTMLEQLLRTNCPYIGILGPKKKLQRMIDELATEGIIISTVQMERIYSPVGLDIGAETAEEIALSIVAEIKAILSGKNAQSLREKQDTIHGRSEQVII